MRPLDLLLRIVGAALLGIGITLLILTATTPLVPHLSALYYTMSILMIGVGALALVAKYK